MIGVQARHLRQLWYAVGHLSRVGESINRILRRPNGLSQVLWCHFFNCSMFWFSK